MQDLKRVLGLKLQGKRRIKQFNFFNWLSNVKNLVLSNGSEHLRNVIQWHENSFFYQKNTKNRPGAGGFAPRPTKPPVAKGPAPRPPSVIPLSFNSFLNTFPKLDICTFQLLV